VPLNMALMWLITRRSRVQIPPPPPFDEQVRGPGESGASPRAGAVSNLCQTHRAALGVAVLPQARLHGSLEGCPAHSIGVGRLLCFPNTCWIIATCPAGTATLR